MAAINATVYPVYGQAYRIPCAFRDISGNLITGWTSASANAYPDNGAAVSLTISEAPTGSGYGYIDIPAAQMTCSMCGVVATIGNSNATAFVCAINTVNLSQFTGRYDAQSLLRLEQLMIDLYSGMGLNGAATTGAQMTFNNPDGSTHFQSSVTQGQISGQRSKTV